MTMRLLLVVIATLGLGLGRIEAGEPGPSRYGALLDDYLSVVSKQGEPLITRFDYARLHAAKDRARRLAAVRTELLDQRKAGSSRDDQLAWAINLYNFLVIEAVVENLDAFEGEQASVMNITIDGESFFDAPIVGIGETTYSLNRFERRFVFAGYLQNSGRSPPAGFDVRAHFALVCAAKGCPPLATEPYTGESLQQKLDAITRAALASDRHLQWDAESGEVAASSLFTWYIGDFQGAVAAFAFLVEHAPADWREDIEKAGRIERYIEWDWALNQTPKR